MVLDPVNRSSRWRYDVTATPNYDDNQIWCGGLGVMTWKNITICVILMKLYIANSNFSHNIIPMVENVVYVEMFMVNQCHVTMNMVVNMVQVL